MIAVDARFAGGTIFVERDDECAITDRSLERVEFPGHTVHLFPHEAAALAEALETMSNTVSTSTRQLRHRTPVDEQLWELEP